MAETRTPTAHIGKSVVIKGQLSGSEDLYLDGEVEGTVDLPGNTLTVGPSARIRANISARTVIIQGAVTGNVRASEKVELKNTSVLTGDIATKRIAIDDGAFFKGGVDVQKNGMAEVKPAATAAATPAAGAVSAESSAAPGAATSAIKAEQPSLIPTK